MWRSPLGRVRVLALLEGASFLILLFVAMPLKYLGDMPMAVKIAGWVHGGLFLLVCGAVIEAISATAWPPLRAARVVFAALLPLGPFVIDSSLRREDEALRAGLAHTGRTLRR